MDNGQLIKGLLPTLVLAVVANGDNHGYNVLRALRAAGLVSIGDASVYGALQRLYAGGMLSTHYEPSVRGPARKCYSLTPLGSLALEDGAEAWAHFRTSIDALMPERKAAQA